MVGAFKLVREPSSARLSKNLGGQTLLAYAQATGCLGTVRSA